jgi:hypothetical protein
MYSLPENRQYGLLLWDEDRNIFGPTQAEGVWIIRYSEEIYVQNVWLCGAFNIFTSEEIIVGRPHSNGGRFSCPRRRNARMLRNKQAAKKREVWRKVIGEAMAQKRAEAP